DNKDFLKGAKYQDGQVGFIRHRPFLLSAGTTMPCVLKTKIITSYPSIALCQLTKNVYSDDGKNILIRAGALLQGEQTRVLKKGVARVFVNWATVKDGNVRVHIDALGADGLGASGLPAWIDNHFWERFGGAMLLSFVDDALAAAASNISKENTSLSIDNTRSATKSMAELALENSIGIPPTAYVNQGEMLSVIVPRNIDFSPVYENQ
ncbi:TrbI/VirB10 family protein, partial [Arsenophonus nasoniae]|uniref:TrbI/VirB10 family protein n=1 Tax=Arsenophonus nasoniae TaxID=638 RepID=UPI00387A0366